VAKPIFPLTPTVVYFVFNRKRGGFLAILVGLTGLQTA
jgi:hypothetical protein